MTEIVMPRLSDSMEEGTILTWLKQVGEEVAVGEELVEIETDKANMAYEADVAGTLTEILAQEGETLAIGAPIAVVGDGSEATAPAEAEPNAEEPASAEPDGAFVRQERTKAPIAPEASPSPSDSRDDSRVKASPLARRLAKEQGIDLATLTGSGPGGRIVKKDVKGAAAAAPGAAGLPPSSRQLEGGRPAVPTEAPGGTPASTETAKGETTVRELSKLQEVIARRMAESKATAPHFYLEATVDMSAAVEGRARLKAATPEGQVTPSFNDMVVKACALALREFPKANGAYRDGRFELHSRVNVGVAVAAEDALVVPTVFDADRKGLAQIAADARAVAARVRDGSVTPPELSGGTFTVSNLGMYGIRNFGAVINPPQAAILAVGAIEERPVVRDGEITTAQLMDVTLACDHRILYGAEAAEFLARVRALLEEPLALAL
jgi:pyruvate dehydrogenase E2 component (dihydrolipoamide acetyltransferase)